MKKIYILVCFVFLLGLASARILPLNVNNVHSNLIYQDNNTYYITLRETFFSNRGTYQLYFVENLSSLSIIENEIDELSEKISFLKSEINDISHKLNLLKRINSTLSFRNNELLNRQEKLIILLNNLTSTKKSLESKLFGAMVVSYFQFYTIIALVLLVIILSAYFFLRPSSSSKSFKNEDNDSFVFVE